MDFSSRTSSQVGSMRGFGFWWERERVRILKRLENIVYSLLQSDLCYPQGGKGLTIIIIIHVNRQNEVKRLFYCLLKPMWTVITHTDASLRTGFIIQYYLLQVAAAIILIQSTVFTKTTLYLTWIGRVNYSVHHRLCVFVIGLNLNFQRTSERIIYHSLWRNLHHTMAI